MSGIRVRKTWLAAGVVFLILAGAAALGIAGCGKTAGVAQNESTHAGGHTTTTAAAVTTTMVGFASEGASDSKGESFPTTTYAQPASAPSSGGTGSADLISTLEASLGQKVISDAQLEIEVASGKFQSVFDQARLLADRYGGYIVSSNAQASGADNSLKSGTIALRIPSASFTLAMSDASKLGIVRNSQVSTQDVTQEYVDLQAQITNAQAQVKAFQDLMARAKTVDEILQVQQVLSNAQTQLDELKGRAQFLNEHTNYSTLTMSIFETGVEVKPASTTQWGVTKALKDALHNLVNAGNAIVRGLGVLIPILVVLAIIGLIVFLIQRAARRRSRSRGQHTDAGPAAGSTTTSPEDRV